MRWTYVIWDDTPGGNVEHVEQHDLTTDDVDYVLENEQSIDASRSTGRLCIFGHTSDGRYIVVVYEEIEHRPPHEILADLAKMEAEIQQGMKELEGMLK